MERPRYREFGAGALARFAECFWSVDTPRRDYRYPVLPDGCVDIVYWPEGGLRVVGTMTKRLVTAIAPASRVVGIRFRPGMAGAFLKAVVPELVDRWAPLDDLWGARARLLKRQLEDASTAGSQFAVLASALRNPQERHGSVESSITALVNAGGALDLDWVAGQAALSPRQFRRRCIQETGLSPKQLSRVLRFRKAAELSADPVHPGWALVACECGYADQAHLIRDFREFSGLTPTEFVRDRFLQDQRAASK